MTLNHPVISPKKLIEVALPLDAINVACAREKSIRHGHPSTLHLWWARRPLAAARAVIFSQLVNDPEDLWRCQNPGQQPNAQIKGHWTKARGRLFNLIEDLVKWENTTNERVLNLAREEIRKSWREVCELNKDHPQAAELFDSEKMPGLHDPFAGGGTIPLEAQRLGLEAYASDLNPVAVLINKAMIEIPPRFAGRPPVSLGLANESKPKAKSKAKQGTRSDDALLPEFSAPVVDQDAYPGAKGLAEDVRYYGQWIRDEACRRIGHLYPPVVVTPEMIRERPDLEPYEGEELTVIAWLWARTVKSPNPAYSHIDVPLASTFVLSNKPGKQAYVEPVLHDSGYEFRVRAGQPPAAAKGGTKSARGANFRCVISQVAIEPKYIKAEAVGNRMGQRLMAIVAEGSRGRIYISPSPSQETHALASLKDNSSSAIHVPLANDPRNLWCLQYGLTHFDHLFTRRQLAALTTFSDLVSEAREMICRDALAAGLSDDGTTLEDSGTGARAYAEAVSVYCGLAVSKSSDLSSTICYWQNNPQHLKIAPTFARQALPMNWDYAEGNPLSHSSGNYYRQWELISEVIDRLPAKKQATAFHASVLDSFHRCGHQFISTDPPYYDNISYADLSDYFYIWIRRSLKLVFPKLLATIAVPKAEELIASPYRHGSRDAAEQYFLANMTSALRNLAQHGHPSAPITLYYAFKQTETEVHETANTGWETFLDAALNSGLSITGTWPMRTERAGGLRNNNQNALASSIILVCRPRSNEAPTISRRQFIRQLNETLPIALDAMTRESEGLHSPVAPVDLSQAIIGPGMAIFSRYEAVLEADGTPMSVRTALQLINRFLAEDDFDADTQFCLHWFEQYGWDAGKFGEADVLARAKGTTVEGVKQAGVVHAAGGEVWLLKWSDYPSKWDPQADTRLPVWEVLHHLIRIFQAEGEAGAARVYASVQGKAEPARQLAYRLYTLCERKNWAEAARRYNELVTSWSGIETAAAREPAIGQGRLF